MSTIHNPSQFNPEHYDVVDYIDAGEIASIWSGYNSLAQSNREAGCPEFNAAAYAQAQADEKAVRDTYEKYFGVRSCPTQCQHCGTGRARYFAVAFHKPTNTHIAVGHICADHRLGLTVDEYRFDRLKERAAAIRTEQKRDLALAKLAESDAELADAFDAANFDARHEATAIAREQAALGLTAESTDAERTAVAAAIIRGIQLLADISASARRYDYVVSDKQRAVLLSGLDKSRQFAAANLERVRTAAALKANLGNIAALEGRVTLKGRVASLKHISNDYGTVTKYLVVLEDGRKTFGSLPADLGVTYSLSAEGHVQQSWNPVDVGSLVEFVATVEQSDRDPLFYFHSRPVITKALKALHKAQQAGKVG
jgi:hypothetical protein